jgi:hypothetical protein
MSTDSAFVDLRRLAEWFATRPMQTSLHIERIVQRLGATCVPLLGRELSGIGVDDPDMPDTARRDAARAALAQLARSSGSRTRVIVELRRIADSEARDENKVCALGLLAELGERGAARFHDPGAIQRSSAIALAAQLDDPAAVASAADMMIRQLPLTGDHGMVSLLAVMADAVPAAAHRLASELCARLDIAVELRERIAEVALVAHVPAGTAGKRAPRPTLVSVLAHDARTVVIASRKVSGVRRWRRWAVLIGAHGAIEDCLHEDDATADADVLVASLVGDGYAVTATELDHAKALVAAAACRDVERLPPSYYVGRDLLELGDAHLARARMHPTSATLGRAVELIADDDISRARLVLARCDAADPDVAAATAACLIAQGRPGEAVPHLARAIDVEPAWPLHHWNLATACHQLGDVAGCYQALRRFVATSAAPSGLAADPDQPERIALATRLMTELARSAKLAGTPLQRPRRKRRVKR